MSTVEMDKLELEIKRARDVGLILANQLNEKIDECEELKNQKSLMDSQLAEHAALKAENLRLEAALNRILDNYSDGDLVIEVSSEALYGDR